MIKGASLRVDAIPFCHQTRAPVPGLDPELLGALRRQGLDKARLARQLQGLAAPPRAAQSRGSGPSAHVAERPAAGEEEVPEDGHEI